MGAEARYSSFVLGYTFNSKMKTLVAGPWIGEFGWELFCWQGFIRKLSRSYDKTIVYSRKGHDLLYTDFAEFREHDPVATNINGWRNEGAVPFVKPEGEYDYIDGTFNIGFNYRGVDFKDNSLFFAQEFVPYSALKTGEYDVLLNVRKKCTDRDWDRSKWFHVINDLEDRGYKIACIGVSEFSEKIEGVDSMMDIPLSELAGVMKGCKLVVGPSSGVMHFAALCETPHLVWSSEFNRAKYETLWNPFKTRNIFVTGGFNPDSRQILDTIYGYIER